MHRNALGDVRVGRKANRDFPSRARTLRECPRIFAALDALHAPCAARSRAPSTMIIAIAPQSRDNHGLRRLAAAPTSGVN